MRTLRMSPAGAALLLALGTVTACPGAARADVGGASEETVVHEVQKGDNLHLIAGYYYKDPRQWKRIFDRNASTLSDADVIIPGTVLHVESDPSRRWNIPYGEFLSRIFD